MTAPALVFDGVSRGFRTQGGFVDVLRGLDLSVSPGEVVAVVGANGSGKSTTIRLAATLVEPTSGRVLLFGRDAARDRVAARRTTGVFLGGERAFYWRLSVGRNLLFAAALRGLYGGAAREEVGRVAGACGLTERLSVPVRLLSCGMRARLGFARACLGAPRLLLLDEPFASVDEDWRDTLMCDLDIAAARGASALVATHDPLVRGRCDTVVRLAGGGL